MRSLRKKSIETQVIHAGFDDAVAQGAVVTPIYQTAMFQYTPTANYHDLKYVRLNNLPNQNVLAEKLAVLEGADAAVVTSSGMSAISTAFLTVLKAGDHVLVQKHLYGGTHSLVTEDLPRYGITYSFVDPTRVETWEEFRQPNTRACYVEAMSNPLLEVADHKAVVTFAQKHKLVSMIDNTFASPINFRAAAHGYDLVLHSATKYLNGHSDLAAGVVAGRSSLVTDVIHKMNHLGGALDPHACFLLERGIKTLALRVREQNANAMALADMLKVHPKVSRVLYPGLSSHPQHAIAKELFSGFGGVLSFELKGGLDAAEQFLERMQLIKKALSLGGVETLASRPAAASHVGIPVEERAKLGVSEGLVRVAVGIEGIDDLRDDFTQALAFG